MYHYDAEDITARHRELATDAVVYGQVLNRAQAKPPVAVSPAAALCVSYFKARFDTHFIYSMPADLWALVVAAEGADVQQLDACQLLGAMQDDPLALDTVDAAAMGSLRFFKMVFASPEAKTQVRAGHLAAEKNHAIVAPLQFLGYEGGTAALRYGGEPVKFDVLRLCEAGRWQDFMMSTRRWADVEYSMEVQHLPARTAPVVLSPLELMDDDDDEDEVEHMGVLALAGGAAPPMHGVLGGPALDMVKEMIQAEAFSGHLCCTRTIILRSVLPAHVLPALCMFFQSRSFGLRSDASEVVACATWACWTSRPGTTAA